MDFLKSFAWTVLISLGLGIMLIISVPLSEAVGIIAIPIVVAILALYYGCLVVVGADQ